MEEFALADLTDTVKRNITLIFAIAIPVTVASALYGYYIVPTTWEARTSIIFEETGGAALSMLSKLGGGALSGLTGEGQGELFRVLLDSRSVRGRVVDELNLVEEFDARSRQHAINQLGGMYEVNLPVAKVLVLEVDWPGKPRSELARNSKDPAKMSAKLAKAMVASLEEEVENTDYTQATQRRKLLEEQLQQATKELTAAENKLVEFATSEGIINPESQASAAVNELQTLQKREANLQSELDGAIARKQEAESQLNTRERMTVNRMSETRDPAINRLRQKVLDLQQQITEQREVQGKSEKHPDVASLRSELQSAQKQLSELLAGDLQVAEQTSSLDPGYSELVQEAINNRQRVSEIRASIEVVRAEKRKALAQIQQFPSRSSSYNRLARAVKLKSETVARLSESYEMARIAEASSGTRFAVIDEAIPPLQFSGPSLKKICAAAMAGSLLLGLIIAFILEGRRKTSGTSPEGEAEEVSA